MHPANLQTEIKSGAMNPSHRIEGALLVDYTTNGRPYLQSCSERKDHLLRSFMKNTAYFYLAQFLISYCLAPMCYKWLTCIRIDSMGAWIGANPMIFSYESRFDINNAMVLIWCNCRYFYCYLAKISPEVSMTSLKNGERLLSYAEKNKTFLDWLWRISMKWHFPCFRCTTPILR